MGKFQKVPDRSSKIQKLANLRVLLVGTDVAQQIDCAFVVDSPDATEAIRRQVLANPPGLKWEGRLDGVRKLVAPSQIARYLGEA